MRFYKFLPLLVFIYTNIIFANNYEQEYKIEVLIYKNNVIETQETFQSLLDLPKEDTIKLYGNDDINNEYSNFSNISNFFINLLNGDDILKSYPKIWFREDRSIKTLNKLENKILNDKDLNLISSKSWIQTIPNYEDAKFLNHNDLDNKNAFYIKLYKKRFMHIHVISYIDDELNIYINEEKRIFDEKIYLFDHPYFGIVVSINEI